MSRWQAAGITSIGDIFTTSSLKPFDTLKKEFNLPESEAFTYTRIAHLLGSSNILPNTNFPEPIYQFYFHPSYPKKVYPYYILTLVMPVPTVTFQH